jgi:hypothetical protein
MAYLRDKELNNLMITTKRVLISSIVKEHMYSNLHGGSEYVGGFERYINKVLHNTEIISNEDFIALSQKIADERIEDIKSNAWGTCILRKGTHSNAKCSIDGVPQRFNAEPKLCLGCINADIGAGNFEGIVVYTQDDVEACRSDMPFFMKKGSLDTIRIALKRVRKLNGINKTPRYEKFIQLLDTTIKSVENGADYE